MHDTNHGESCHFRRLTQELRPKQMEGRKMIIDH